MSIVLLLKTVAFVFMVFLPVVLIAVLVQVVTWKRFVGREAAIDAAIARQAASGSAEG